MVEAICSSGLLKATLKVMFMGRTFVVGSQMGAFAEGTFKSFLWLS